MKHIRNALIAILVLMIALPCVASAASGRYLAYVTKKTYVYKKASTSSTRRTIKANTSVYVLGTSGKFYKVQNTSSSGKGYVLKTCVSRTKPQTGGASLAWKSKVVMLDWYKGGSSVLKKNAFGYLYDISTGTTLRIKRMGGSSHADVEPATAADTAKLLRIAGGKFSWDSHAVILHAGGKYVACAINTMPHGDQTIKNNNYEGQFCLHMLNSKTHGSDSVNTAHQAAIKRAYNWAH